jgi:flagellar basal body-associated protein FliL
MEMSRLLKIILVVNLVVLAVLAFTYPHLMISPGKVIPGHEKLNADCFACHAPFTGSTAERCGHATSPPTSDG